MNDPAEHLRLVSEEDVLGVIGDSPPLFPDTIKEVDALCTEVQLISYRGTNDARLVFTFQVIDPESCSGAKLQMFARYAGWKTLPVRSKLWKLATVATGGQLKRKQKVTKSLFVGRIFRCRVRPDKNGHYTVVDTLIKKLTG